MRHPNRESSHARFERELLPSSMFKSIEYWLPAEVLPAGPTLRKVQNLLIKFRTECIQYFERATEDQIPSMIRACKERTNLLCDFCQGVNELLHQGYTLVPVTRDYQLLKSDYKIRFAKKIIGYDTNEKMEDVVLDVNITNNPRMYKFLYYALELALLDPTWRSVDTQMLTVIIQSISFLFEAVKLTDQEILDAENEFLETSQLPDCWDDSSELATIMKQVGEDMKSPNPPKYIADFKQARRSHDGYMYGHPWTIDDAWYSVSSSGCRLKIDGKPVPNIGLVFSAFEPDYTDPIDEMIGYRSFYANEPYPGLEYFPSSTTFVPKTSSRGLRCIHPNSNGRQDRGSYFENMEKHILTKVLKCDTTFDDDEGIRFLKEKQLTTNDCLICTDIHSATDYISHQFLLKFWNLMYRPGVADFLLRCHSGEGSIIHHSMENGKLVRQRDDYCQISGIKCGTRSNFAVGLTEPHNFICRCTMKACGLEDYDPLSLYRVHGDDIAWALPESLAQEVLAKYTKLANEAGFRVHPITEKGMIAHSNDLLYRAEFNKQTWLRGRLVSRIPHRLFFRVSNTDNQIAVILWLSQYTYLDQLSPVVEHILSQDVVQKNVHMAFWNFLVDKKMFGIPSSLRINLAGELSLETQFKAALSVFEEVITSGVYEAVFNNRQRLSKQEVDDKVRRYTELYTDMDLINTGLAWLEEHGVYVSKLHVTLEKNRLFADELRQIFDQPYIWYNAELGFFSDEEKSLIRRCLPYCRISGLDFTNETIDDLLSVAKILRRTQPHSIGKKLHASSNVIVNCIRKMNSCS